MTDFEKCGHVFCNPVLQVRSQMGPGDYTDQYLQNGKEDINFYQKVELTDVNRNDCRIVCRTCSLAAGWNVQDFPGAPGAGRDYMAKRWGELVKSKHTKDEMLAEMTKQFGEDAVNKHFGLAL